ncbi:MAG TPA: hypothetical protein VFQ90_06310 [Stellaceae bacterium]|jgi:uncharacterized membrane protein YraQ (UPF0718 family)|nr:hypothetical protein [Stellaceae bacterium]
MPPRRRIKSFDWSTGAVAVIAVAAGAWVYWHEGAPRFLAVLSADTGITVYMLPKVLAGCLIGTLVTLLLPREVVARWVGVESGLLGLAIAYVAALILPGSPLTIYPIASAFLAVGADVGAVVVYITAWSLIGYQRALVWELPFLGPEFVIWRIVVSLPLPLIAGLLARLLMRSIVNRRTSA